MSRSFLLCPLLLALSPACRESAPPTAATPAPTAASPTSAAAPAPVATGWGTLEGRLRLSGTPPKAALVPTSGTVVSVCGEQAEDRSLIVGGEGALAHVVVSLKDGAKLPASRSPAPEPVLDQKKCVYDPPVMAARAGASLAIRNSDPLVHNVRAASGSNRSFFNVAMPLEGMTVRRQLPAAPGDVPIRCDIHPWMRSLVRTFDHSYFATTGADGRFRLEVPEGTHTVVLWHERLPEVARTVNVRAGETVQVDQEWAVAELK
ncbi:carboxypeptidase regulatory-like domain-containing protein [Pyxidicoccus sp. 3LG]